ncbi:ribonuclease P protein component [Alicycliphilus denitrificans]|uniref:Ribonuclease P protein component n=1 Tax=Alicycliphilus denitrificans TaxID=179636 RepID=A0A3R7H0G1_9BURK|nr:ribonuclease P protein component [Alicycliphilus denitrificans]RKJ95648.1 ribonuclease P protein component [Alicycliphilus denitrificans]
MHRLKTRAQFQAVMAGGAVSRTAHFALHRLGLAAAGAASAGPGQESQALFAVPQGQPGVWLGAMVPKRWARRAVTRNAIKRQIHAVAAGFEPRMPQAAHVVRLRAAFDRKHFVSATSDALKAAVRAELQQLFAAAERRGAAAGAAP